MKDPNKSYRLAEEHIVYGLEGKVMPASLVRFDDLALYDAIVEDEYPYSVTLEPGHKYSGEYRFETDAEVVKFIERTSGTVGSLWPELIPTINSGQEPLKFFSHRGYFIYHVRIIKKGL